MNIKKYLSLKKYQVRTFTIDKSGWINTGTFQRYFTNSELYEIKKCVEFTMKKYKQLGATDSDIIKLNEQLLKEEINGTSL